MADGCDRFLALMHARIDADISPDDDRDLSLHLDSCSSCSATFQSMRTSVDILAAMPAPDPGPAFAASVMHRARAARQARARASMGASVAAAAAVAMAASLVLGVWGGLVEPTIPGLMWGIPRLLWAGGKAGLAVSEALIPVLDVVAGLLLDGALALLPLYLLSLLTITCVSLLYRIRRPMTTLPVLSI